MSVGGIEISDDLSHDVMAAMLVSRPNPAGIELDCYVNFVEKHGC